MPMVTLLLFSLVFAAMAKGTEMPVLEVPSSNQEIIVDDVKLNVVVRGFGSPIVLLHGFGASVDTWRNLKTSDFSGFQLIAVDLKGFGQSDKPFDGKYEMKDQAALILALMRKMNLKGVVLIGHSFGGGVALIASVDALEQSPDLISKLVLIDPACYPQELPDFIRVLRIPFIGRVSLAILPKHFLVKQILNRVFFDRTKITTEIINAYSSPLYSDGAEAALVATARSIIPNDVSRVVESFRRLKLPTYIFWGEEDGIIKKSSVEGLAATISGSHLTTIPSCGHAPQEECAANLIPLIQDILQEK